MVTHSPLTSRSDHFCTVSPMKSGDKFWFLFLILAPMEIKFFPDRKNPQFLRSLSPKELRITHF